LRDQRLRWCFPQSHQWQGAELRGAGKLTSLTGGSRDWCHWSNFGFFDHREVYTAPGLLATDGVQLSQRGKRILGHELVGLIERALN